MAAILIMTVLIRAQPAAAQGDAEQGRQIGFTCLGCHGIEGQRNAYPSFRVPRLGGQGRDYMRTALRAYREGSRSHPTMHAHASSLTDLDIEDLLAWFDTFAGARDLATAEMVTGADAAAICVSCHGLSGAAVVPQPPILAGQHAEYLEHALNQYKDGKRAGNVMVAFAASLSEADIAAISRFYASQDGLETLAE
jgi:cytochrome c553